MPLKEKKIDKSKWPSEERFQQLRRQEALNFAPSIYQCQKCGYPYVSGYCCTHCRDSSPGSPD